MYTPLMGDPSAATVQLVRRVIKVSLLAFSSRVAQLSVALTINVIETS